MLLSVFLCPLQWSFVVATITEIPLLVILPNCLVQQKVLRPLRTQTGGTIMVGVHQPLLPYRVFDLVIQFLTFFFTASHYYLLLELIKSCCSIMKYMHDYKNRARNRLWKPKVCVCVCVLPLQIFVCLQHGTGNKSASGFFPGLSNNSLINSPDIVLIFTKWTFCELLCQNKTRRWEDLFTSECFY